MIPQEFIQEIIDRADIVEVISSYIPLKRAGSNFKALCPFHTEKTPSFFVSPTKQIFHCFGCGKGGNVLHFIMLYDNVSFFEAVKTLSEKLGMKMPISQPGTTTSSVINLIYKINEQVSQIYHKNLLKNSSLLNYLYKRGLQKQDIENFRLGFAPSDSDYILNILRKANLPLSMIERAGLITPKQEGGFIDFFRNRLIIPVFDIKNRVVGFGARRIKDIEGIPKYINSPQTPVFNKSKILFGLNWAKSEILNQDCVYIVEGYFDVIVPYSRGIRNVVAPLGTSLTKEQIKIIKRYTNNVVLVFDKDEAGTLASIRALGLLLEEEINTRVVVLPEGEDPASLINKKGEKKLLEYFRNSKDFLEFLMEVLINKYTLSPQGKKNILEEIWEFLSKISNPVLLDEYMKLISKKIEVDVNVLYKDLRRFKSGKKESAEKIENVTAPLAKISSEKILIKLLLIYPHFIERVKQKLDIEDFEDPYIRKILEVIWSLKEVDNLEEYVKSYFIQDYDISNLLSEIEFIEIDTQSVQQIFEECLFRISINSKQRLCKIIKEEIKKAKEKGEEKLVIQLLERFNRLRKVVEDEKKENSKRCRAYSRVK